MAERAHIGLGSNLGNRRTHLSEALRRLSEEPGIAVGPVSQVFETAPVDNTDQPAFLNAAAAIDTDLDPHGLLRRMLAIETAMGRERTEWKGPRTVDLDLLTFGDRVVDTSDLTLPHPRLTEREFALVPLLEIAPDLIDPRTGEPFADALARLGQTAWGSPAGALTA